MMAIMIGYITEFGRAKKLSRNTPIRGKIKQRKRADMRFDP